MSLNEVYKLERLPKKVLPNNLLVKIIDKDEDPEKVTDSGIVLKFNDSQKRKARLTEVEVVLVPNYVRTENGTSPLDSIICKGCTVLAYHPSLHNPIEVDGVVYYYLRYEDVFALGGKVNE